MLLPLFLAAATLTVAAPPSTAMSYSVVVDQCDHSSALLDEWVVFAGDLSSTEGALLAASSTSSTAPLSMSTGARSSCVSAHQLGTFWDHTKCSSGNGTNACCATVWSPTNAEECCSSCNGSDFGFKVRSNQFVS